MRWRAWRACSRSPARAQPGRSRLTLEFNVGTNMDRALLLVSNRLNRVNGYPAEASEPTLDTAGSEDNAIAWFVVARAEGNERPIHEFGDFIEDVIKDRIERVPGVSRVNVYGGTEREIQITTEPRLLARYGLTVSDVTRALRQGNASITARRRRRGQAPLRDPHRGRAQHARHHPRGGAALLRGPEQRPLGAGHLGRYRYRRIRLQGPEIEHPHARSVRHGHQRHARDRRQRDRDHEGHRRGDRRAQRGRGAERRPEAAPDLQ